MRNPLPSLLPLALLAFLYVGCQPPDPAETADIRSPKWEKISLDFGGPSSAEMAEDNPFLHYRLDVRFYHDDRVFTVPGYYAADGNAGETSADTGSVWRVNFRPDEEGLWRWEADFRRGDRIAVSEDPGAGERLSLTGQEGTIFVDPPAEGERGRLMRTHPRYLQWAESKDFFLKGGADSPENLLAFKDFDGTYRHSNDFRDGESKTEGLHHFTAHEKDWREGDLTWQDGKGKGLVGGLNYLAQKGINSVYMLTMNINGDGKDVWPYTSHEERYRFDCSKLDQWEAVFDYMDDELGMMLHLVMQETENETLLDGGDTGPERSIYFRELVARFGHHRAVTWNMGEENGPNSWSETGAQTNEQQAAGAAWFAKNDPYQGYVVVHTHPNEEEFAKIYTPLLGNDDFDGLSLQIGNPAQVHEVTRKWLALTADAGAPWIMTLDEIGPWYRGLDPDDRAPHNNQDSVRALSLWGNLMAGGAGAEWYFGAFSPHNDLGMEDWRSRDRAWTWTAHAINFFGEHVPFAEMEAADELTREGDFCLAKRGEFYLVYLPFGGIGSIDLTDAGPEDTFEVLWFDPANGGALQTSDLLSLQGGGLHDLDLPPGAADWTDRKDWAVIIRRESES
ncbi:DUF5060 domain-containing protein [Lewinella sp. W8]|uniref:DUF5060 domain-containing protein n=1 Tax=Lewinella sp. W8 TaxID=2528208 RepID=UPI001067E337|nr:DUF5060 domain-containing protein [Lewinella sp. W8]MTB53838.1 DUF5060 domain-containing protein [Lewinella sp. W8]